MFISFRDIAHEIDRLYPPTSLRDLAGRFRYPNIMPGEEIPLQTEISLERLGSRVEGEGVKTIDFLHYNTWLLRGSIKLEDILSLFGGLNSLCICLETSIPNFAENLLSEILKKVFHSDKDMALEISSTVCGLFFSPIWDPIDFATCMGAWLTDVGIQKFALKLIKNSDLIDGAGEGIDKILTFLDIPASIVLNVLQDVLGGLSPGDINVSNAPCIEARAREIGIQAFAYDLVSLVEVWQEDFRKILLRQGKPVNYFTGPDRSITDQMKHTGSGLLVFSPTLSISDGGNQDYNNESGVYRPCPKVAPVPKDVGFMVDSDKLACKGIQLTLVDVGYGQIELYSTHLYNGGDIPDVLQNLVGGNSTPDERKIVREKQIRRLAHFVHDKHNPSNIAIIAGDFNIFGSERYNLYQCLADINSCIGEFFEVDNILFDDWYTLDSFIKKYPDYNDNQVFNKLKDDLGHTDADTDYAEVDEGGPGCTFFDGFEYVGEELKVKSDWGDYCALRDEEGNITEELTPWPDYYFREDARNTTHDAGSHSGDRVDYIFVQRPVEAHAFNLDVSRIRRRAFRRPIGDTCHGGYKTECFMSDHVGLEVTLYVSPK